jgi:glycosyltransferase involved in cell wall biosynthesis
MPSFQDNVYSASPGLAERLSCNARAKAEKFDWANILNSWEELFMQVSQAA